MLAEACVHQAWQDTSERESCSCDASNQVLAESAQQDT